MRALPLLSHPIAPILRILYNQGMTNANNKEFRLALSYDDVLLVPHYSDIPSRKLIDLSTLFSKRIRLNIPVISANMDTVTGSEMAIHMAREGGMGIIHRFQSAEEEADEVRRVKRAESIFIHDPITIHKEATLREAIALMEKNHVTGVIVVSPDNDILGILTARDIRFKTDGNLPIQKIMTPKERMITAKNDIRSDEALCLLDENKIEKLPLVDAEGKLSGLITASDYKKTKESPRASKDKRGRLLVGAAIGVKDGMERAELLVKAGADALVIDIAHGHHKSCIELVKKLKKKFPSADIVAGNVATAAGTLDLIKAGADAVKVGIGPGAACSTRIVAGSGVPQLTAVMECALAARKFKVPIIADGGIKNSGDLAKAIGAGAGTVMIGNLFSGSKESPGEYYIEGGEAFKIYRGLASRDASADMALKAGGDADKQNRAPEGIGYRVTFKGEVRKILQGLVDGLQSGMSYTGARNLKEFCKKAEFVRITDAGMRESKPRSHQV
jgi:IMP dehydrogenase